MVAGKESEGDVAWCLGIDPAQLFDFGLNGKVLIAAAPEHVGEDPRIRLIGGGGGEAAERFEGAFEASAKLLFHFAQDRIGRGFTRFELSARLHEGRGAALADQRDLAVGPFDDAGSDVDFPPWVFDLWHRVYLSS